MKNNQTITALLSRIDTPEKKIYYMVEKAIIPHGKDIITILKTYLNYSTEPSTKARIEKIIENIEEEDIKQSLKLWNSSATNDLVEGAIMVSKFVDRVSFNSSATDILTTIKNEIEQYFHPDMKIFDKLNTIQFILYEKFGLREKENDFFGMGHFNISFVLESKIGYSLTNGIIYLWICNKLNLPVYAIRISKQFILAYFEQNDSTTNYLPKKISYFIDPISGKLLATEKINANLKKQGFEPKEIYFVIKTNKEIIQKLIKDIADYLIDSPHNKKMKVDILNLLNIVS